MTPDDPNAEPIFQTIADAAAYEATHGREYLMHRAMNLQLNPYNRRAVEAWFWWEQQKSEERARQATVVAAEAARKTATWTFGIAIVTLSVVIATLAAPMLGRNPTQPPSATSRQRGIAGAHILWCCSFGLADPAMRVAGTLVNN